MLQSPYLAMPQANLLGGASASAQHDEVAPVAGAVDGQSLAVDAVDRRQVLGARQAVLGVGDSPHAVVGALELTPVARAAAEVRSQPRVALGHHVLCPDVPFKRVL